MIRATGLTKRLGRVKALDSLDLTVADGEKVAVLGPNGAGKSTLLRLVAGLLRPSAGTMTIDGSNPRAVRASLGYLGHDPFVYGHLTARENLEFFADLYGVDRGRAGVCLEHLDITHKADARVNHMSMGECRKVALARALLHEPSYLLLDEPFSNLDGQAADLVQSLIEEPGRTVLVVTHDRQRALQACDRTISLNGGRLADNPSQVATFAAVPDAP